MFLTFKVENCVLVSHKLKKCFMKSNKMERKKRRLTDPLRILLKTIRNTRRTNRHTGSSTGLSKPRRKSRQTLQMAGHLQSNFPLHSTPHMPLCHSRRGLPENRHKKHSSVPAKSRLTLGKPQRSTGRTCRAGQNRQKSHTIL